MRCFRIGLSAAAIFTGSVWQAQATSESVVYSFCSGQNCSDGSHVLTGLIAVNGKLYGTTEEGGGDFPYYGTLYAINLKKGTEKVKHAFQDDGVDGYQPEAGLVDANGTLYGTTEAGGAYDYGTVFSFDPATNSETVIHSFQNNGTDGIQPTAGLTYLKGLLYGTTGGGGSGYGTVYSINPATGSESVVYSFQNNGADALEPTTNLAKLNGILYGTSAFGGAHGGGAVFSVDPESGVEKVLYSFQENGVDGYRPEAGLIGLQGLLYGTTTSGGTGTCGNGCGTVFSIDPMTGAETIVYAFQVDGTDGSYPAASLVAVHGVLYGTTVSAGANGRGTAFSLDPNTGVETVLHAFGSSGDGQYPWAGLLNVKGTLYGTTEEGGTHNEGTVFAITP